MAPASIGSRADSYITDLLTRQGHRLEVITDHDVHAEGAELLSNYAVVLTGQHPNTIRPKRSMRSAPISRMEAASSISVATVSTGRWCRHASGPWAFELRRAEGGIRLWATQPGESYHAFDGSYGGLWRRLGRPPQCWPESVSARRANTRVSPTPSSTVSSIRASPSCAREWRATRSPQHSRRSAG